MKSAYITPILKKTDMDPTAETAFLFFFSFLAFLFSLFSLLRAPTTVICDSVTLISTFYYNNNYVYDSTSSHSHATQNS